MRKFIISAISAFMCFATVSAQNISDLWIEMPDSILPYFNKGLRTEMVDSYKIKAGSESKNLLNGTCSIKGLTDSMVDVQLSSAVRMKLCLLPVADSTKMLCMVKTFSTPALESSVTFYGTDWKRLKSSFGLPDMSDAAKMVDMLIARPDTMSQERFMELKRKIEPAMVLAEINEDNEIVLQLSCPFLTKVENSSMKCIFRKRTLKWNGKTFK